MLLLLQQSYSVIDYLPWILAAILMVIAGLLNAQTVELAISERDLLRETNKRLQADKEVLLTRVTMLEGQTNLDALRKQVSEHHNEIMAALTKETTALHLRLSETLRANNQEIIKGFAAHAENDNKILTQLNSS